MEDMPRRARVSDIITIASYLSGIPVLQITGKQRDQRYCRVRFAACLVARDNGHSYPFIGRVFERDHSTIIHACRQADNLMGRDPKFAALVDKLRLLSANAKPFVADRMAA